METQKNNSPEGAETDTFDLEWDETEMGAIELEDFGEEENTDHDMPLQKIILQVNEPGEEGALDLVNVAGNMGKSWRFFAYFLVFAVSIGFFIAALSVGLKGLLGTGSYASAVITFNFDGIDEGLDPNGGLFQVNKVKSTPVINAALEDLGWEGKNVEAIRANLKLTGIIPESVKQQIAVINTVAESSPEYYANIEELNYFPSQYTVTLTRCRGMSGDETRELLDAILAAYREYFMDNYADTSVLGVTMDVLAVENYDYMQASEIIGNQIDTMQVYVDAKVEQAPDFRANSTGLTFSDLSSSIQALRRLDLNNYNSFIQSNNLTKDAGTQVDYLNYQVRQYNFEIQELQNQLSNVERMITEYEKDPVIVMSNQESVTETTQTSEYYDQLLEQKLELNRQISEKNTDLNETYGMIASLNSDGGAGKEEDYAYADTLLENLLATMQGWTELVQKTAQEYYESELYADAYRVSIPAQYTPVGGLGELIRRMLLGGGIGALVVFVSWAVAGLKTEIVRMRAK